jgi:LEA14-like dessication related protein
MFDIARIRSVYILFACLLLTACASTESLVTTPRVDLTSVELESASFDKQTFLLAFDVANPNAFPLPVKAIKYRVMLDDERFAGGETVAAFTIPAGGEDGFVISVDLDILNSASQLTSLLHGGVPDHVKYRVEGSLTVDIPFTRPLPFSSSGTVPVGRQLSRL